MSSPTILEFEKLLAPISDESPSGVELREDGEASVDFYNVKDARSAASDAERRLRQYEMLSDKERELEEGGKPAPPDWRRVYHLTTKIIAERSKDLWCAAWLIEALARSHGFAGLRDGFVLARELCERYWESIHPAPDDDGYVTTVAQLEGLNGAGTEGTLVGAVAAIPITDGKSAGPFSSNDYIDATELEQKTNPDIRNRRIEQGTPTLEMIRLAVSETSPEFFRQLYDDVSDAIAEFDKLDAVLKVRCGETRDGFSAAPPTSNIRNALADCQQRVRMLAGHVLKADEAEGGAEADGQRAESGAEEQSPGPAANLGKAQSREEALGALIQVAEFFRRTEPHSPVSYALEQAVRWARMSLPELMTDLIRDEAVRKDLFRRAGITLSEPQD